MTNVNTNLKFYCWDVKMSIVAVTPIYFTYLLITNNANFLHLQGPRLLPKFRVKSFLATGQSLETPVEPQFYNAVKSGLVVLLGARSYFASRVLTPYRYTLGRDYLKFTPYCYMQGRDYVQLSTFNTSL